ncbi:cell division protein ZapA [Thiorhodococcus fuscus]|uniref:Cell division protein ZapA n=1 Tax=Thiorhodococcus fuscus TaxID=527200 RepID=A0ABW4Y5R6_9GAMM
MIEEPLQVSIKILEKEYRIACEYHEQDDLRASARLLDNRMREIRQSGRVIGTDRIAVIAALNIAHDLIQIQRSRPNYGEDTNRRLRQLQDQVNAALITEHDEQHPEQQRDAEQHTAQTSAEPPLDASDERV